MACSAGQPRSPPQGTGGRARARRELREAIRADRLYHLLAPAGGERGTRCLVPRAPAGLAGLAARTPRRRPFTGTRGARLLFGARRSGIAPHSRAQRNRRLLPVGARTHEVRSYCARRTLWVALRLMSPVRRRASPDRGA